MPPAASVDGRARPRRGERHGGRGSGNPIANLYGVVRPLPALVLLLALVAGATAPAHSTDPAAVGKLETLMDRQDLERDDG